MALTLILMTSTGYEDKGEGDKFVGEQQWILKEWLGPIVRPGGAMGILEVFEDEKRSVRAHIEFESKEEFEWLKQRIDGGRRVE